MSAAPQSQLATLTTRQREVLELLARGLTNKDIASALGVTVETVRTHVSAVLVALDVTNRTEAASLFLADASSERRMSELLARPAIAVLPIVAPAGDVDAQNLATGLSRDLTGLLGKWVGFPVIASNSTAGLRDAAHTPQAMGLNLGARFVIDGALRRSRSHWRLVVHVIDTHTGHLVWSDTCDFPLDEVFEVQDAVTTRIVAQSYAQLMSLVAKAAHLPQPKVLSAWQLGHRGFSLQAQRALQPNEQAERCFHDAVADDDGFVLGHYGLGLCAYDAVLNQWAPLDRSLGKLRDAAEQCLNLAPHAAEGYFLLGRYQHATDGHTGAGIPVLETAVALNPSFAAAHALLGQFLLMAGRLDDGLARMQHAVRLGPRSYVAGLAVAHFARSEWPEALRAAEQAIATVADYPFAKAVAAASAYLAGERARAVLHGRALFSGKQAFDPEKFRLTFGRKVASVARMAKALKAVRALV